MSSEIGVERPPPLSGRPAGGLIHLECYANAHASFNRSPSSGLQRERRARFRIGVGPVKDGAERQFSDDRRESGQNVLGLRERPGESFARSPPDVPDKCRLYRNVILLRKRQVATWTLRVVAESMEAKSLEPCRARRQRERER